MKSKPYTDGTYRVEVWEDGAIQVKPGDWLSKYAAAICKNPHKLDVFYWPPDQAGGELKPIIDKNRLEVGDTVIYKPTWDLWKERQPGVVRPIGTPRTPQSPYPDRELEPGRVLDFLRYLKQWLCPVNDWKFTNSGGLDVSASIFAGGYCTIGAQRRGDPEPTWFHGVSVGLDLGVEDFEEGSLSLSPTDFGWSPGFVGKFPTAGRSLSADEICGTYLVVDFNAGVILGWSISFLLFGGNGPPQALARSLVRYFRGKGDSTIVWPSVFNGFVAMTGGNLCLPVTLGASLKMGVMHRLECVTG
jgi:hypothetical protein